MIATKLEILVDFGPNPEMCVVEETITKLKCQYGINQATFKEGAIIVETTLPSCQVLEMVTEMSGKRAVLQGFGDNQSAVAMITSHSACRNNIFGIIRFMQSPTGLIADGTIDGLPYGKHGLHVHTSGDLSEGCNLIGEHYNPYNTCHGGPADSPRSRHAGDLGNIDADMNGRATFKISDNILKIWDIIGRSIAVTERTDDLGRGDDPQSKIDGNSGRPLGCGIIARSAGVLENPKRICHCDGIVVWEEKGRPLAGKGRRDEVKPCCKSHEDKLHVDDAKPKIDS